jgi:histidinol phosphatase-like enzyme
MSKQTTGAVDIDGVLASLLESGNYPEDYKKKTVISGAVESLKTLRALGHRIVLFTARYEIDRVVTEKWLHDNGFAGLYDELIMDKPKFDYVIDDRAIRFEGWAATIDKVFQLHKSGRWY